MKNDWLGPRQETEQDERERNEAVDRIVQNLKQRMENTKMLRAKMRVTEVAHIKDGSGNTESERVRLNAVYGDTEENKQWSKWTPSAQLDITINNPDAIGKFSSGHEYFVILLQ